MTRTQAEQLLWYIERGTEEGTYYGNKGQFNKRRDDLVAHIEKGIALSGATTRTGQ
jgi:hypothetical protein